MFILLQFYCIIALRLCWCLTCEAESDLNYGMKGFEVLTAVSTKMTVFWVVAPCSL
jgi:uncharacterized membrane protein